MRRCRRARALALGAGLGLLLTAGTAGCAVHDTSGDDAGAAAVRTAESAEPATEPPVALPVEPSRPSYAMRSMFGTRQTPGVYIV